MAAILSRGRGRDFPGCGFGVFLGILPAPGCLTQAKGTNLFLLLPQNGQWKTTPSDYSRGIHWVTFLL